MGRASLVVIKIHQGAGQHHLSVKIGRVFGQRGFQRRLRLFVLSTLRIRSAKNDICGIHPGIDCQPFFQYFDGRWIIALVEVKAAQVVIRARQARRKLDDVLVLLDRCGMIPILFSCGSL